VKRQVISTDKGPRTGLPYSQGIRHGDLVYVAGQVALDPATGQVVTGGIREQTRQVLQNVEAILQAAGTSLAHSVECLCLLSDIGDFAAFNEVYKTFFPTDPPARTTVQAVLPRPGLLIEIRTVAAMPPARAAARARKPARRPPAKRRRR
jgi:2-iminobutanoate/2-iminopropanoate deaminase